VKPLKRNVCQRGACSRRAPGAGVGMSALGEYKTMWKLRACLLGILLVSASCGSDDDPVTPDPVTPDPTPEFIGTFNGGIQTIRDVGSVTDSLSLSLESLSPPAGTFFRFSDGAVGTITAAPAKGNQAEAVVAIAGEIHVGGCDGTFTGSADLTGETLVLELAGSDCNGEFQSSGSLSSIQCVNLAGPYDADEEATFTITYAGQSETLTESGRARVELTQSGCTLSYTVPGVNAMREGTLNGNLLVLEGPLVIFAEGVSVQENSFRAEVRINNNYDFSFSGTGRARARYQGQTITVVGTSNGYFHKRFDVAVAILRGGPVGAPPAPDTPLDMMKNQAIRVDPSRVIAHAFGAGFQIWQVENWLQNLNGDREDPMSVILVGHSLGGDAARQASLPYLWSRILLDPISWEDLQELPLGNDTWNQRELSLPANGGGRVLNALASTTDIIEGWDDPMNLLGHHVSNATEEWIEDDPPTNHHSVVSSVLIRGVLSEEVRACLQARPRAGMIPVHAGVAHHDRFPFTLISATGSIGR